MQKFIKKPSIDMYPGIKVTKETEFTFNNENVNQTLKDLKFCSKTTIKGDDFQSTYVTTINLSEGDVLIFEGEGRGYIKPVESLVTVEEAIEELGYIKEV